MIELIPVLNDSSMLGDGARAILGEIVHMLDKLVADGTPGQIDVGRLPLSNDELTGLKQTLGEGEATIELSLNGPSRCKETAFPGVWWIRHMNQNGEVIAELIEVAKVPDILAYEDDEIVWAIESLNLRLTGAGN